MIQGLNMYALVLECVKIKAAATVNTRE